jgi:Zn-dependent metalloprotease
MKEPGSAFDGDLQPSHMSGYVRTASDNGGVHINSGIPNRAFHLAATAIGGRAWEGAGRIWYDTISTRRVGTTTQFRGFASATLEAAGRLFGQGSSQAGAVAEAWSEVGVPAGAAALDAVLG